jgi:hypothetical protein
MNWRTACIGMVMIACLGSLFAFSASNDCLGWTVPLILAISAGLLFLVKWIYKVTTYQHHNFKLSILNRLPLSSHHPVPSIPEPASLKIIGIGKQRLCVEVKATCRSGFPVKNINFRCLQLSEVGTDIPVKSGVPITRVSDPTNVGIFRTSDDGYNGIDGEYTEIRGLGRNRCLYFEIVLDPAVEWVGYLSFKAINSTGLCSYSRYAIEVQNFPAPEDDETAIPQPLAVIYEEHTGSFYHESPIHRPGLGRGMLQLARIKVVGNRMEPVQDVQVKIHEIIPEQEQLRGLPFHAQRMNDNTEPYQRSTVFAKDQEEYFDVVGYARFMISTGQLHFRRIDGVDGVFNDAPCHVLVRITGLGINKIDRRFRVWVDAGNNLRMVLAEAPLPYTPQQPAMAAPKIS